MVEDRLTQDMADGKITAAQKTKILAKLAELKANREAQKGKMPEERRQARHTEHESLQKWANDNSIPLKYLRVGMPGPHGPKHW